MNKQIKIIILVLTIILIIVSLFLYFTKSKEDNSNLDNTNIPNEKENEEGENMENRKIKLTINNHELTATLNENSSSIVLIEELKKGPIIIKMNDYANMEKVGDLGVNLPRNDEVITTSAGDLILYQGNNFVIYYDTNHYSLTKLGKIDNISPNELKDILGTKDVTVKLSLE